MTHPYTAPKKVGRFRIFLASSESILPADFDSLTYPLMASFKFDGVRAFVSPVSADDIATDLVFDHQARGWTPTKPLEPLAFPLTRSLLGIPNRHTRALLATLPAGVDGEVGVLKDGVLHFRGTTSAIMSEDGEPDIRYYLFDNVLAPGGKWERYLSLLELKDDLPAWVIVVEQRIVYNADEARAMYTEAMARQMEGLIFARLDGYYKPNRSTFQEGLLIKAKEKERTEITITGVIEEMENTNEAKKDERGLTKRSHAKAGKVGKGRAGKLVGRNEERWPGVDIVVASGLDDALKKTFFEQPPIGELATIEFQSAGGYDKPRCLVFIGLRDKRDLS